MWYTSLIFTLVYNNTRIHYHQPTITHTSIIISQLQVSIIISQSHHRHPLSSANHRYPLPSDLSLQSFTTTAAFVISAISPLLSVSTFGSFSGILISVNYILVITVLPVTIVTYHYWWDQFKCCCCCPRDVDPIQEEAPKQRWIVKFFSGPYFSAISHKVARWVFLGLCMAFIGFCAYSSSRIEVQEEQVRKRRSEEATGHVHV